MLDTHGRKYVEPLIGKGAEISIRWGLSPNQVTCMAVAIGVAVGPVYLSGYSGVAIALLWFSGYLDAVDGSVARKTNKSSKVGTLLDILFDRIVECGAILAAAYAHPEARMVIVALLCAIVLSMTIFLTTGALTPNEGVKSFRYQAGVAERTEGFIMISLMLLFNGQIVTIAVIFAAMVLFTAVQRFIEALKIIP